MPDGDSDDEQRQPEEYGPREPLLSPDDELPPDQEAGTPAQDETPSDPADTASATDGGPDAETDENAPSDAESGGSSDNASTEDAVDADDTADAGSAGDTGDTDDVDDSGDTGDWSDAPDPSLDGSSVNAGDPAPHVETDDEPGTTEVEGPHGLPVKRRPALFDRDPSRITAAMPADIPTDWGVPTPTGGSAGAPATSDDEYTYAPEDVSDGAPDDEEMPLADHVEEMAIRLFTVAGVMAVVAVLALPFSDNLIQFLWFSFLDGPASACGSFAPGVEQGVDAGASGADCPHVYSPLALILARLKVASLVGLIVALPVFVYQTYLFMRPGLYPRERRYYLAAVPTSLVLAAIGVAFAYFAVLRAMFDYFITYSDRAADLAFGLGDTFNLIILMLGFFALIFQIPLFVMLAIMMGVTTRQWLQDRRLYFWGAFAAIAFVFSPDPTGMAPLMVAVTMIALFEGTLFLLRWTGTSSPVPTAEEAARRRPQVYLFAAAVGYVLSPLPVPTGYYTQLPPVVTESLSAIGLGNATPLLVGGSLIVCFEAVAYVNKNYYGSVRLWRACRRARLPVWGVAIVAGYLGSPDPTLFRLVNQFTVGATAAAVATAVLVALFEGALFVARRRSEASEPTPPGP